MAKKRMVSLQIIDTDAFLDMPATTQLLYFHLTVRADDEGFVDNPKKISRLVGIQTDDLKILIAKRFVLAFDSGVVVIKHWLIHNNIRMDRFNKTMYSKEKETLTLKENNSYTENGNQMTTSGCPKLSKVKLSKVKLSKVKLIESKKFSPPLLKEIIDYCSERKNDINPENFLNFYESKGWMIGKNKMKNWKAAVRTWEQRDNNIPKNDERIINNILNK